jgi:hypothetical protein
MLAEIDRDMALIRDQNMATDDLLDEIDERRGGIALVPESHPDRSESIASLHQLVTNTVERALKPALDLSEDLAFAQMEAWRNGELPIAPGDVKFRQGHDQRGRLVEERTVSVPDRTGVIREKTRTRILLNAGDTERLGRLVEEATSTTKHRPTPEAIQALDRFCEEHGVQLPSVHVQPDQVADALLGDRVLAGLSDDLVNRGIHLAQLIADGRTVEEIGEIISEGQAPDQAEYLKKLVARGYSPVQAEQTAEPLNTAQPAQEKR